MTEENEVNPNDDVGYPDLTPAEIEAIEQEDRRKELRARLSR